MTTKQQYTDNDQFHQFLAYLQARHDDEMFITLSLALRRVRQVIYDNFFRRANQEQHPLTKRIEIARHISVLCLCVRMCVCEV